MRILSPRALYYARLVVALVAATETYVAPRSSFFLFTTSIALLAAVALAVAPKDCRRYVGAALVIANPMMPPLVVLAARSMWFWLLVAALVCTVITEWLRWWWEREP